MLRETLSPWILMRILLRSFLLQASWNFERMQSLGVLFAMAPGLRRLYPEEEVRTAAARYLEYFNTHPFMASPVLGSMLALEEQRSAGREAYLDVQEFKGMITAPYAAMGDAFFWGGVRPLAAGIALFFAFKESLWAPVIFLLLFNLPHLWFRVAGLIRGYLEGLRIVEIIQRRHLPDLALRLKEGTVVLLGGLCAWLTFLCLGREQIGTVWGLTVIPLIVGLGWLTRKGLSSLVLVMGLSLAAMLWCRFA